METAPRAKRPRRDSRSRDVSSPEGSDREAAWEELSNEIHACRKCPLGFLRTHAVVYRGGLSPRIVFIGEAPGAEEDRTGVPFVGRSGRELDRAVARLGLIPDKVGVLNLLKCRPPANRFDRAAARTCRPYLERQLGLLRPRLVVTLGANALRALDPAAPPILKAAGRPRPGERWDHFPLVHPAATLRSRAMRRRWDRDVGALGRWLTRHAP